MDLLTFLLILIILSAVSGGFYIGNNIFHLVAFVILIILLFRLLGTGHGLYIGP